LTDKPIGIIDSGVGGLTVAKEVMRQLPNESILYLGDTARCPYGSRPVEEIKQFTWEIIQYLRQYDIKMLIIACNTITSVSLEEIRKALPIPVLGVIHPGARAAIKVSKRNSIAVIGTETTIRSKAYEKALKSIRRYISVYGLACPKFVPLVESGEYQSPLAKSIVYESLKPLKQYDIDTLILGCTHYPLLEPFIRSFFANRVKVISSGEETAREASVILDHLELLAPPDQQPTHKFLTTGSKQLFRSIAEQWLEMDNLDIERIQLTEHVHL